MKMRKKRTWYKVTSDDGFVLGQFGTKKGLEKYLEVATLDGRPLLDAGCKVTVERERI